MIGLCLDLAWKKDSEFQFFLTAAINVMTGRLELQERIRRHQKEPTDEDKLEIDRQRSIMSAEFELLEDSLRRCLAVDGDSNDGKPSFPTFIKKYEDNTDQFQNIDDDEPSTISILEAPPENTSEPSAMVGPEKRTLIIPSTSLPVDHPLCKLEMNLRQQQAHRYINALKEVIAEKSFQYTNVIRVAPRKSVITRARNAIMKLNHKIQFYAKVYCRCRAAFLRLGADKHILDRFRDLTKHDIKASSAIRDPNIPGSSSLRLSWIWQMSPADANSPSHLRECEECFSNLLIIIMFYFQFNVFIGYAHVLNIIAGEKKQFS